MPFTSSKRPAKEERKDKFIRLQMKKKKKLFPPKDGITRKSERRGIRQEESNLVRMLKWAPQPFYAKSMRCNHRNNPHTRSQGPRHHSVPSLSLPTHVHASFSHVCYRTMLRLCRSQPRSSLLSQTHERVVGERRNVLVSSVCAGSYNPIQDTESLDHPHPVQSHTRR